MQCGEWSTCGAIKRTRNDLPGQAKDKTRACEGQNNAVWDWDLAFIKEIGGNKRNYKL